MGNSTRKPGSRIQGLEARVHDLERELDDAKATIQAFVGSTGMDRSGSMQVKENNAQADVDSEPDHCTERMLIDGGTGTVPDSRGREADRLQNNSVDGQNEPQRMEGDLFSGESQYSQLFHNYHTPMLLIQPEYGRIIDANPAACSFYGWRRDQLLQMRITEINSLPPDQVRREMARAERSDGSQIFYFQHRLANGIIRDVEVRSGPILIGQHRYLFSIVLDITERKRAEQELKTSEERLTWALQTGHGGAWEWDLRTGEAWRSPEMYELWAVQTGTHLDTESSLGLIHEQDRGYVRGKINESISSHTDFHYEFRIHHTSLGERWMESYGHPVYDNADRAIRVIGITFDITERKKAEEALKRSESALAQAGEMAQLGAWIIEYTETGDINTSRLHWSDEVFRIFGYEPGQVEVSNDLFFDRVHPEDRSRIADAVARAVSEKYPYEIEHRIIRPDGSERIVYEHAQITYDNQDRPLQMIGAIQDITDRKRTEQALRESEARFRQLADSMPQLVWTARPDGVVDYYNQRYVEYGGIEPQSGGEWEWGPVLHPDDVQSTLDAWRYAVETGTTYQVEHQVRMADGSIRWHLSRGVPVRDERGRVIKWYGTATDIHDQKLAEADLQKYAEQLERSNRDLQEFAYMASHDLQEPLRKIEAFGESLVQRATNLNEQQRDYLVRMRNAANRMRNMVDSLLQLSRLATRAQPFIRVDLVKIMEEVITDLEYQIQQSGGEVDVADLPSIEADPVQMQLLLQNLIINALKFQRPGATPRVKTYSERLSGDTVRIFVKDNGIGFDEKRIERIFQPFQRLVGRSEYDGSGMGLAICRRIVERHGGDITATSVPGQGSTFIITLPVKRMDPGK